MFRCNDVDAHRGERRAESVSLLILASWSHCAGLIVTIKGGRPCSLRVSIPARSSPGMAMKYSGHQEQHCAVTWTNKSLTPSALVQTPFLDGLFTHTARTLSLWVPDKGNVGLLPRRMLATLSQSRVSLGVAVAAILSLSPSGLSWLMARSLDRTHTAALWRPRSLLNNWCYSWKECLLRSIPRTVTCPRIPTTFLAQISYHVPFLEGSCPPLTTNSLPLIGERGHSGSANMIQNAHHPARSAQPWSAHAWPHSGTTERGQLEHQSRASECRGATVEN
jgi:hypothetical protein